MTFPLVSVITTTGWRSKAFALAEKYMGRQSYSGKVQWIVVSDDKPEEPTKCHMGQEYYQCPLVWSPGINTQRYALDLAISKVKGDAIVIWEDDDIYKPDYLATTLAFLEHADIVGECGVTYYSLKSPRGFMEMKNYHHASLCSTAFKKSYLPFFQRAVHSGNEYIDLAIWNHAHRYKHKLLLFYGKNMVIGLKGVPGRTGIGVGHQEKDFVPDPHFIKLRELIGPHDAAVYEEMCK